MRVLLIDLIFGFLGAKVINKTFTIVYFENLIIFLFLIFFEVDCLKQPFKCILLLILFEMNCDLYLMK